MVAEPWILKLGSQVSTNLKHALYPENSTKSLNKKQVSQDRQTIGILSFEVANLMSKVIHLHKSLSETEILKLRTEILKSEGIKALVSSDEKQLLELAFVEKLDDLNRVASAVSRLGKRCTIPALQGFEHVYADIVSGIIDVRELGFLVKDMEGMVRKMERYVGSTVSLYAELEVMNELEVATKKFQQNQHEESRRVFEQKLAWQRQDVRHLKSVSLWHQTYDKVVELLARTVCTIYIRLFAAFADYTNGNAVQKDVSCKNTGKRRPKGSSEKNGAASFRPEDFKSLCGMGGPGKLIMECLSLSSKVDTDDRTSYYNDSGCFSSSCGVKKEHPSFSCCPSYSQFGLKSRLLAQAPSGTVGASALALHYANVIIVVEKLLRYSHLVGDEARDDLYQMLPTSLRKGLKTRLKSYVHDLAIYDAPLAHDWKEKLDSMLRWLAPLAHSMIRWQSERNFEQHQIVTRTNVLLVQTLYFADRRKIEAAICELLLGLNYICRYEQQQNALLDCASSFDFEDCMEWQLQFGATFNR